METSFSSSISSLRGDLTYICTSINPIFTGSILNGCGCSFFRMLIKKKGFEDALKRGQTCKRCKIITCAVKLVFPGCHLGACLDLVFDVGCSVYYQHMTRDP